MSQSHPLAALDACGTSASCAEWCRGLLRELSAGTMDRDKLIVLSHDALAAAHRYGYVPPAELVELIGEVLQIDRRWPAIARDFRRSAVLKRKHPELTMSEIARRVGRSRQTVHDWTKRDDWQRIVSEK
jgi:Putative ATPase subunit of terminase (gpP-like)